MKTEFDMIYLKTYIVYDYEVQGERDYSAQTRPMFAFENEHLCTCTVYFYIILIGLIIINSQDLSYEFCLVYVL